MHPAVSRRLFEEQVGRWPPDLAHERGWVIHAVEYPILDCTFTATNRTALRLCFDFSDWDDSPPAIELLDMAGTLLNNLLPNPTNVFNSSLHPTKHRPFICMAGAREFHTHPSHLNERWEQFRGKPGFEDVGSILTKLWHAWQKGVG